MNIFKRIFCRIFQFCFKIVVPLLVKIPVASETGSKNSMATVIAGVKHKYTISDFPLISEYAVLDSEITNSFSPFVTATCGMGVLVYAIEAYIENSTTLKTKRQALKVTELVYQNLYNAYVDGNNLEAKKNMLEALYLAGCTFTGSYVGYCHAISHSLNDLYNIPLGIANAIIIPYILEAYGKKIHRKLKDLAIASRVCTIDTSQAEASKIFIQSIKELNLKMGIGNKISEIKKEDIEILSKYASKQANPIYPAPVLMDYKELQKFYYDLI